MDGERAKKEFKFCAGAIRTKACACFKPTKVIGTSGGWFSNSRARMQRRRVWNSATPARSAGVVLVPNGGERFLEANAQWVMTIPAVYLFSEVFDLRPTNVPWWNIKITGGVIKSDSKGGDCDDNVAVDSAFHSGRTLPHSTTWPLFWTQ